MEKEDAREGVKEGLTAFWQVVLFVEFTDAFDLVLYNFVDIFHRRSIDRTYRN